MPYFVGYGTQYFKKLDVKSEEELERISLEEYKCVINSKASEENLVSFNQIKLITMFDQVCEKLKKYLFVLQKIFY